MGGAHHCAPLGPRVRGDHAPRIPLANPGRSRGPAGVPAASQRVRRSHPDLCQPPHDARLLRHRLCARIDVDLHHRLRRPGMEHARSRALRRHLVEARPRLHDEMRATRSRRRPSSCGQHAEPHSLHVVQGRGSPGVPRGRPQPQEPGRHRGGHLRCGTTGQESPRLPRLVRLPARRRTEVLDRHARSGRAV